jgi:Icc-related predicted phosphoesterase
MKIRIYSDLHLEFGRFDSPFTERGAEDLVVLAGDIDVGVAGVQWAARTFPHVPVIYVAGNHEFFGHDFSYLVDECKAAATGTNVHVLERDSIDVGGIRVLGTTLWTDYRVAGEHRQQEAMEWAEVNLADSWQIRTNGRPTKSDRFLLEHLHSVAWLDEQIAVADRPVIVVTHHAPTLRTTDPFYAGSISTAAFHSNTEHLLRKPVKLWIHGHTHYNVDLRVRGVRIVANQWGYPNEAVRGFRRDGLIRIKP